MAASKKKKTARTRAGAGSRPLEARATAKAKAKARRASPEGKRTPRAGKSRPAGAQSKPVKSAARPAKPAKTVKAATTSRAPVSDGKTTRARRETKRDLKTGTPELTSERSSSVEEQGGARGEGSGGMGDPATRDAAVQLEETKPTPRPRTATGATVARGAPPALPTPIATFTI